MLNHQALRLPFALLLVFSFVSVARASEKSVLFIHTNKSNGPAVILFDEAFQAAVSGDASQQISLYNEYTDLWRFPDEDYARTLNDFYQQKYAGQHFDLIVVESLPALKFLLAYGDALFPGTPVVFCVVEQRLIEALNLKSNFTGVLLGVDFKKSLESALRLQPDTRSVVVVSGASPIDQSYLASARRDFQQFDGRVEFTYLTDLPLEEIARRVSRLPERNIVFYVTMYRDSTGHSFTPWEAAAQIGKAANAPFYSVSEVFVSAAGGVGGYLWSVDAEAMETAKTARRILAGAKPQDLPIYVGDTNRYIFDWRQLQRWGIDEQRLPPSSILRFKEPSFWEQYKWRIGAVTLLCIVEALLIIWLLINRKRRRLAEEETTRFASKVKAEHEHLEDVVSKVPGIVWESRIQPGSNNRKAVFVSPYVEKMLGYSVDEWLSTPGFSLSITLEEDREEVTREIAAIIESGTEGVLRFRWRAKDGRVLWVEARLAAMRDETGKTIGLRGVTLDITERQQAEEAKNILAAIVGSSDDAILSKTLEGTITSWNAGAEKMYGYSAGEIVGQHISTVIPADLQQELPEILGRIRSGETILPFETQRLTKSSRRIDVSLTISPIKNEQGTIIGGSTIARDITDRKRAIEDLRESEERFRTMADTAPVMIWVSGRDMLCTFFNQPWLEFTGRTMEQELGNGWAEGVHPEDYERCLDVYRSAFRARRDFAMEYRLRRGDGQYRWVIDRGVPRLLPNGDLAGYIGTCLDITEGKRNEQALQQLTGRLLKLQDEERRRVAGELHDGLGQNLAIIKNRAMIGLQDTTKHDRIIEQLEEIAATATASIFEVREIARNLRPYELDRLGLVAAIESMIERVSDSTSINLSADLERIEGLLSPEAETSVYRIVQEGLNNVVKHSHATTAQIRIKKNAKQLVISVRDNGKGIPSPAAVEDGTEAKGFGLAGIAERVRVLGGSLDIDSQPASGTNLTITLELVNGTPI